MKATKTVCMCDCGCPIKVLDADRIICESCVGNDHWNPAYEMKWAKSFATVALIFMAVILIMWVIRGGIAV